MLELLNIKQSTVDLWLDRIEELKAHPVLLEMFVLLIVMLFVLLFVVVWLLIEDYRNGWIIKVIKQFKRTTEIR